VAREFDYSKLRGRIVELYGTQQDFCQKTGRNESTLSLTLNNKRAFTQEEIATYAELLDIPGSEYVNYFFTPKVAKTQL